MTLVDSEMLGKAYRFFEEMIRKLRRPMNQAKRSWLVCGMHELFGEIDRNMKQLKAEVNADCPSPTTAASHAADVANLLWMVVDKLEHEASR